MTKKLTNKFIHGRVSLPGAHSYGNAWALSSRYPRVISDDMAFMLKSMLTSQLSGQSVPGAGGEGDHGGDHDKYMTRVRPLVSSTLKLYPPHPHQPKRSTRFYWGVGSGWGRGR